MKSVRYSTWESGPKYLRPKSPIAKLPKNVTGEYFTRGNSNKLLVKRCRYELRKNFFSNRIVNLTMSLCMNDSMIVILLILSKIDLMHIENT